MVEWLALGVAIASLIVAVAAHWRTHRLELARDEERRAADRAVRLIPLVLRRDRGHVLRIANEGPGSASSIRVEWNCKAVADHPCFFNAPAVIKALAAGAWIDIHLHLELAVTSAEDLQPVVRMAYVDSVGIEHIAETSLAV
jgi:hypothetical protein